MLLCAAVRLTLSDIAPRNIPLFPPGATTDATAATASLLTPLILINANRVKNLDGTNASTVWQDGEPLISIKKFIAINKTEDLKQYNVSDLLATSVQQAAQQILAEGIWEVNARVSAVSEYPNLVDLDGGPTPVDEAAGYPPGTVEYLTNSFTVNTAAVVQWNATYLSGISSSPKPGTELKVRVLAGMLVKGVLNRNRLPEKPAAGGEPAMVNI